MGRARRRSTQRKRPGPPIPTMVLPLGANVSSVTGSQNPMRPGMPALDGIHSRIAIASAQDVGQRYTILRTNEIDAYELPTAVAARLAMPEIALAVPAGDNFKGTSRKAAKLSIASAAMESFNDLAKLVQSLPADSTMVALKPPISTAASSNRVSKEKRNVRVRAFLYAASREADNDFHLIIGRDPAKLPELYVTMELSGLPPKTAKSYAKLKAARDAFKAFFDVNLPGLTYDFYDPPIPVRIEGSLFFDMSHATGQRPGPPSLKSRMPTIWEVHPLTSIVFEP